MTMTKLSFVILTAVVLAGVAALVAIRHVPQLKLREEIGTLRQQVEQLPQLAAENKRLSNQVAQAVSAPQPFAVQLPELLRLRGEIARLRQENRQLSAGLVPGQDSSSAAPS